MSCYGSYNNGDRAAGPGAKTSEALAVESVRYRGRKLVCIFRGRASGFAMSALDYRQVGAGKGVGRRDLLRLELFNRNAGGSAAFLPEWRSEASERGKEHRDGPNSVVAMDHKHAQRGALAR